MIKEATYVPFDTADYFAAVGDLITYDTVAKNVGNVELTGTVLVDSTVVENPVAECAGVVPDPWKARVEFACTPRYTIKQGDIDAGRVYTDVR